MTSKKKIFMSQLSLSLLTLGVSMTAAAYIGPGAGISAIGSAIAFIAVILLLFIGFFWYPVKKFLNRNKIKSEESAEKKTEQDDSDKARGL